MHAVIRTAEFISPLWITDKAGEMMAGCVRYFLYLVASFCLSLMDELYKIMKTFFSLNLNDFTFIWDFFKVISVMVGVFILMRVTVMMMKAIYDEQAEQKINGASLTRRIMGIALVLSLVPVVMPALSSITADLTTNLDSKFQVDLKPSDLLLQATSDVSDISMNQELVSAANTEASKRFSTFLSGLSQEEMQLYDASTAAGKEKAELKYNEILAKVMEDYSNKPEYSTLSAVTLETVSVDNINEKLGDRYIFFNDTKDIILVLVLSIIGAYSFLYICIQVASRIISLMFKIMISPYVLSGIVDPSDNGATIWFRMCIADFVTSFFQMLLVWFSLYLIAFMPERFTGFSKGLFFLAAILSIMMAPSGVAQLIGGDVGASAGLQQLQTLGHLTSMMRTGIRGTGAAAMLGAKYGPQIARTSGNMIGTGTSALTYGVGRLGGGISMNPGNDSSPLHSAVFGNDNNGQSGREDGAGATRNVHHGNFSWDKIDNYLPGSLTRDGSFAKRFSEPETMVGAMATSYARNLYIKSGKRLFQSSTGQQLIHHRIQSSEKRNNIQRAKEIAEMNRKNHQGR